MDKKLLVILLCIAVVLASVGVVSYGYVNFSKVIEPQKKPLSETQLIVIKLPDGKYLTLSKEKFVKLKLEGAEFPKGSKFYTISVESYLTGDPFVDVNLTLRKPYERATIVVGDPSFKGCQGTSCALRAMSASEIGAVVGAVFGVKYYLKDVTKSGNNETAAYKAYEETLKRVDSTYLAFIPKVQIGLGLIGNKKHLLVILRGPREGAKEDRIYCPKEGVLVLEARSERTLFAEVQAVKYIINSQVK